MRRTYKRSRSRSCEGIVKDETEQCSWWRRTSDLCTEARVSSMAMAGEGTEAGAPWGCCSDSMPRSRFSLFLSLPLDCLLRAKDGKMKACGRMLMWMRKCWKANDLVSGKYQQQSRFLRKLADVAFFCRICLYWVNGKVRVYYQNKGIQRQEPRAQAWFQ